MVSLRHSSLVRALTLLLLIWAGLDLGAHSLFLSDLDPIEQGCASTHMTLADDGSAPSPTPDHCFCHSFSTGAVVSTSSATFTEVGGLAPRLLPRIPASDVSPLDRPPQLAA